MQSVKLNLIPGAVLPVVNVSQYDVKRTFALAVYDGAASYDLTGKTVTIRGTKPDNHGFDYGTSDGVVSVSGNTVTISTTQQMTAVGGHVMAELRIESGTTVIGTLNFIIDVEPSALSDDTIISDTEIPVIERDFEAALAEAEADALVAEGYAKGTQDGTPVGSGSPYYHDNAKHYKEEAEAAASGVLEKYPKIVGDYWYIWDVDTEQYVNTGVRAKGTQGDPGEGVPAGGTTGQVLRKKSDDNYDTEWANGGGGASALDDLTDVDITSQANGDLLQYNSTSGEWENNSAVPDAIDALEQTGAVNELPNNGTSVVVSGITWTKNADGTVTANGLASAASYYDFEVAGLVLKKGDHYLSAGSIDGNYSTIGGIYVTKDGVDLMTTASDAASHCTLAADTAITTCRAFIRQGVSVNNLLIEPMIALKKGLPYQPYAMTNKELTDEIKTTTWQEATLDTTNFTKALSSGGVFYCVKSGICYVQLYAINANATGGALQVATGLPKGTGKRVFCELSGAQSSYPINSCVFMRENATALLGNINKSGVELWASFCYPVA